MAYLVCKCCGVQMGQIHRPGCIVRDQVMESKSDFSEEVIKTIFPRCTEHGLVINPNEEGCMLCKEEKRLKGAKHDGGKLLFGCLTRGLANPLRELAQVLTFGAKKYNRDSWQNLPDAKIRYEDAMQRHLNSWSQGEKLDSESGLRHLAHAAINILFLLHFEIGEYDNAPK